MAKLPNYNGSIDLISGLRPKNNGDFPLMEAHDVQVTEEKRLDEMFSAPESWLPVYDGENEGGTTGGAGSGGNYVLELTGESGTLTDEQYQAVVDNFPNVVVTDGPYQFHSILYDSGTGYMFNASVISDGETNTIDVANNVCVINNKNYTIMNTYSQIPKGGLQVKQITFTDRPSLYAWLESNYINVVKTIFRLGGLSVATNTVFLSETGTNFLFSINATIGGNSSYATYGHSCIVTQTETELYLEMKNFITNDGTTIAEITPQTLPDEYWTAYRFTATIYYIE